MVALSQAASNVRRRRGEGGVTQGTASSFISVPTAADIGLRERKSGAPHPRGGYLEISICWKFIQTQETMLMLTLCSYERSLSQFPRIGAGVGANLPYMVMGGMSGHVALVDA